MKILIDSQPLMGQKTGIGNYTEKLINELSLLPVTLELITNQTVNFKKLNDINITGENVTLNNKLYPYKIFRRVIKSNILYSFPIDFNLNRIDCGNTVFHATNFISLPTKYAKQVVTIHDLAFMKYPKVVEQKIYNYMMRWVPYSVNLADEIIADSENTKKDIIELLKVPENKISVIYLAADKHFKKQLNMVITNVKLKYKLPDKYFLYLGTLEPKKNLPLLIEAMKLLKQNYDSEYKLVVVGAKGWKFNPIFERVHELGLEEDVIFTGYIADQDLPAIYSGATAFMFPSLYEGFGIPLLEAMQCEVPVIASNASCIPEVVNKGGILLDPTDVESWVEAMHNISSDKELHQQYVKKGLEQASKFSWEKVARETLEVYEKALKR